MSRRLEKLRDAGAGTIEYVAALLLAAAIVAVLIPFVPNQIGPNVQYALCKIFHAGNAADCESPADQALKPKTCTVASSTQTYGGSVDIAFFQIGKNVTFIRTTDSQGHVTVTAVDNNSLGVGTGVGVGFNWGNKVNIGADADARADVTVGIGDSWVFDNKQDADKFIGEIQKKATLDAVKSSGPLGWLGGTIYGWVDGPHIRDSDIERTEVSVNGSAGVSAGISIGPGNSDNKPGSKDTRGSNAITPNAKAYVTVNASEKAILEHNKKDGSTSITYQLNGGVKGGENHVVGQNQRWANTTGAMKLTYDKNGQLTMLTLTQTHIVNGTATVTTTALPINNDADRQTVYNYLLVHQGTTALQLNWDDMAPTQQPGTDATPLQQLLYQKAQVQKVDYSYNQSDANYGAKVKLGLKLGIGVSLSSQDQKVTGTPQYLGAPQQDGTRPYKPFRECHG